MPPPDYAFLPVTRADFPLLRGWLAEPHVQEWWDAPEREMRMIERDLENGPVDMRPVDMRIVSHEGRPFAYVQDYPARHWDMPHYADLPEGARAIDTFLGPPDMLGRGHAAAYLRQRAGDLLKAGAPAVVIDPSPDNARAVRAYRRAGFTGDTIRPCENGGPVIVMKFRPA